MFLSFEKGKKHTVLIIHLQKCHDVWEDSTFLSPI